MQSWYALCRGKSQSIFRELWMLRMEASALTQVRAGLTTMHWASSNEQLLMGTRATIHVLQFYEKADHVPQVRDFAAWRLLAGTGIDAEGFVRSVMDHGGTLKEMSHLVKSSQHVLASAGLADLQPRNRARRARKRNLGRAASRMYAMDLGILSPILEAMDEE